MKMHGLDNQPSVMSQSAQRAYRDLSHFRGSSCGLVSFPPCCVCPIANMLTGLTESRSRHFVEIYKVFY